jgi:hypothetical protein
MRTCCEKVPWNLSTITETSGLETYSVSLPLMSSASCAGRLADGGHVGDQRRRDAAVWAHLHLRAELGIAPHEDGELVERADDILLADGLLLGADEVAAGSELPVEEEVAQPPSDAAAATPRIASFDFTSTRMVLSSSLHCPCAVPPFRGGMDADMVLL